MGEILLDLSDIASNAPATWFNLEDHDENSCGLPSPTPKARRKSADYERPSWSSLPALPATPAHDKCKEMLTKKTGKSSIEIFLNT